jgi:hypothetical protein
MKYRGELLNYKFKAYYKTSGMTWDNKVPIGANPNFTTLLELDYFSASTTTQVLVKSNNLNSDILFPGEGSSRNPNYNPTPLIFQMDIITRPIEIKVTGANLFSAPNTVGDSLKLLGSDPEKDNFQLNMSKGFNKQIAIVVNCFSTSEGKTLSECPIELKIDSVSNCLADAVSIDTKSFDNFNYDSANPNNVRFKLNIKDRFANPSLYSEPSGFIYLSVSTPGSTKYDAKKRLIGICWTIMPTTDSITVGAIDTLYVGDSQISTDLYIESTKDQDRMPTNIIVTPSDSKIMNVYQSNSGQNYSLKISANSTIDTTNPDILNALKNAAVTIETKNSRWYLPTKQTIPLKIYPKNARLSRTPSTKYAYITSGTSHYLAITGQGALHAWGTNAKGVFADSIPASTATYTPTFNTNLTNTVIYIIKHPKNLRWVQVESYGYNVYAIDIEGTLWGWGANENASLGVGRDGQINTPTIIASEIKWKDIACGVNHAIGVSQDGKVYGWGDGTFLQNGCGSKTGTSINTNSPKEIANIGLLTSTGFGNAIGVSCGPYSSWVIGGNNYLWAFGDLNGLYNVRRTTGDKGYYAPLTNHTPSYSTVAYKQKGSDPVLFDVPNGPAVTNVFHAKKKWNPHIVGTGTRDFGQAITVKNISVSAGHVLAIDTNGKAIGWGNNEYNQCFIYTPADYPYVPAGGPPNAAVNGLKDKVFSGEDGTFIAASPGQSLLIDTNNDLWAGGNNNNYELGIFLNIASNTFVNTNASYFYLLRQIPGKYRSITANSYGGFVETF